MDESKYIVFERTGETRKAKRGEWFEDEDGWICFAKSLETALTYPILRRIPADRVEVAVKPEPYKVVRMTEVHHKGDFLGETYTHPNACALAAELNKLAARIRELEGQVNRG